MASPNSELVVTIPEVQLHKVSADSDVTSTRQSQITYVSKHGTCRLKVARRVCWNGLRSALS